MPDDEKREWSRTGLGTDDPAAQILDPTASHPSCPLGEHPCSLKAALETALAQAEFFQKQWKESLERIKALEWALRDSNQDPQKFVDHSPEFYIKYIELIKSEKSSLEREVSYLQQRVYELNDYIQALYNSYSWKITAPLRRLWDIFTGLRNRLRPSKKSAVLSGGSRAEADEVCGEAVLSPRAETIFQYLEKATVLGSQNRQRHKKPS